MRSDFTQTIFTTGIDLLVDAAPTSAAFGTSHSFDIPSCSCAHYAKYIKLFYF
jgi:hypothetical protein